MHMELRQKCKDFKAYKAEDICDQLEYLRSKYPNDKLAIFLDNASINKARSTRATAASLQIELVYNIPYMPQTNGIEQLWCYAKREYRKIIGQHKVNQNDYCNLVIVKQIFLTITN